MKILQKVGTFIRQNAHIICATLVVLYVTLVIVNAVLEGVDRIVTQHEIDETYRIVK